MKKRLVKLSMIFISVIFLISCRGEEGDSLKKDKDLVLEDNKIVEDSLILNLQGGDWGYLSPFVHYTRGPGYYKMRLIFDSLLERGEEGLIPFLAESWEIDEEGKSYIFKIREGVKWQDGEEMTAEDVRFSFDYYKEHPPVRDDLARSQRDYIEEINLIDDHTIHIQVEAPDATLLGRFGKIPIIPKHIWEDVDDPIKFDGPEAVIGSGPYRLVDYKKEQGAYEFEVFEDYWGYRPAADKIRFIPVSDSILAFENGDIDITDINPDLLSRYEDTPAIS